MLFENTTEEICREANESHPILRETLLESSRKGVLRIAMENNRARARIS